jgi:ABC-2 type transport system permease protein
LSDLLFPYAEAARAGLRDHLVANPYRLTLTTTWPRAVLQGLFFTLLGGVAYGPAGEDFAFVGTAGLILVLSTVAGISEVPGTDKAMGTTYRLRLGRPPALAVVAARSLPWLLEGLVTTVVGVALIGLVTGRAGTAVAVVTAVPVLVVTAVSSCALGLAGAALSAARDAEILAANALTYLILAAGGVLVPAGRIGWLDAVGEVLPVTHGLRALRAWVDGGAWLPELAAEALVGLGWWLVAWAAYRRAAAAARREDKDAFA